MDANLLRRAFTEFFVAREHMALPSASLVPVDSSLLFTVAGMVPFKPWFLGDEPAAAPRVTTVQKCMRAGGKHNDLDAIGTTNRHLTFFEMLGNFSFGGYFKDLAIPYAWELVTTVLGLDPELLWVTVHDSDDEAAAIWIDKVGVSPERIQRMGADNWWQMADTGPCGPCSEIYYDLGSDNGQGGGPAGGSEERYVEIWNLVFMQYNRVADGTLSDLPRRCIDTGAGLERLLTVLQEVESVFDTDALRPVVAAAEHATGHSYGGDRQDDISLRILADHARSLTMLISDGVLPSNVGRGYVLRRIIRRAVLHASKLGARHLVTPPLVGAVVSVMSQAYPELANGEAFIAEVAQREEERFLQTLRTGSSLLDAELAGGRTTLAGETAFRLHDTYGFPVELTREVASMRGVEVDMAGFEAEMERQRAGSRSNLAGGSLRQEEYRELLEQFGPTEFLGYQVTEAEGRLLAVLAGAEVAGPGEAGPGELEVFLDRSPFYAEGGGQVGDTGTIIGDGWTLSVLDTTAPLPGLHRHRAVLAEGSSGSIRPGGSVWSAVDAVRRDAIRRNHTGTHLLQWGLREVLGSHVRQQGSLVAPDRLRFDFSHHSAMTEEQIEAVEDLVNSAVLADAEVLTEETTKAEAEAEGAIAFFGDRYGQIVRVVRAGEHSVELCGGTHVHSLGMVGPIKILSESSIGASTRRIEALTGLGSIADSRARSHVLERAASLLGSRTDEVPERIEELREQQRQSQAELRQARQVALHAEASRLVELAQDGVVIAQRDNLERDQLRSLAVSLRDQPGIKAAALVGSPDGKGVALVVAVRPGSGLVASELIAEPARLVGGGGGRDPEVAVAGGRQVERISDALAALRKGLNTT